MRNFTISNLFASVITRVIDVLAVNGIATRSFHLTSMREHMGYRIEQRRPGTLWELLLGSSQPGILQLGNKRPALQQPAFALAYDITAQSVCPAPRLSQARASWRG
jgi:hypothetical protein